MLQEQYKNRERENGDLRRTTRQAGAVFQRKNRPCINDVRANVIQRGGERDAVKKTLNLRRGNRRGSISETGGVSNHLLHKFRSWFDNTLWPDFQAAYPEKADQLYIGTLVKAYAVEVIGVANCGEFSRVAFADLVARPEEQWVYRCWMERLIKEEDEKEKNAFDHAFTMTCPGKIVYDQRGKMIDNEANRELLSTITVVDAWDDYSIRPLSQFMDKGNPYEEELTFSDIRIRQATCRKLALTDDEKAYIRDKSKDFLAGYRPPKPDSKIVGDVFGFSLQDGGPKVHDFRMPPPEAEEQVDIEPTEIMVTRIDQLLALPKEIMGKRLQILYSEEQFVNLVDTMGPEQYKTVLPAAGRRGVRYVANLIREAEGIQRLMEMIRVLPRWMSTAVNSKEVEESTVYDLMDRLLGTVEGSMLFGVLNKRGLSYIRHLVLENTPGLVMLLRTDDPGIQSALRGAPVHPGEWFVVMDSLGFEDFLMLFQCLSACRGKYVTHLVSERRCQRLIEMAGFGGMCLTVVMNNIKADKKKWFSLLDAIAPLGRSQLLEKLPLLQVPYQKHCDAKERRKLPPLKKTGAGDRRTSVKPKPGAGDSRVPEVEYRPLPQLGAK